MADTLIDIEAMIADWRRFLGQRRVLAPEDIDELEDHLRGQVAELQSRGLSEDEAFLVAIRRLGKIDAISREFALEHTDRLWKHLVMAGQDAAGAGFNREMVVALLLAVGAAVSLKFWDITGLFPLQPDQELPLFYLVNAPFFVLPWLCGYFFWKRGLSNGHLLKLVLPFLVAALVANAYPFARAGNTQVLSILHMPIALWLVVGLAYAGERWASVNGRMDFVRFTGEQFIYYLLIAVGGWIFIGLTFILFSSIGMNPERLAFTWVLPCGMTGAFIVAAWLVESKQGVIENIAPVLTRVFTPLFTLLLAGFLVTKLVTGQGISMEREVLIVYDIVLVLVLGLLLYSLSARDVEAPPNLFDKLQVMLVVFALLSDLIALVAIAGRISEFGLSPNRVAALGENLILLVNLAWSAVLYFRFAWGRGALAPLVSWQTGYLPVYAAWAAVVVVVFPPLFSFQ